MSDTRNKCDPPFLDQYGALFDSKTAHKSPLDTDNVGTCELPLIDLRALRNIGNENERQACVAGITKASSEWGFFQVLNHGVSSELLEEMRKEQMKLFEMPFQEKAGCRLLNHSYRWGTPTATSIKEFSWSEAFHIPLNKISEEGGFNGEFTNLREAMEKLAAAMSDVAQLLARVLAESLDQPKHFFEENCNETTCFLRLNRYPACPFSPEMYGLVPHTDSDFLTILYQDQVGGLQLMKDSNWVSVKPNPDALIVNIGDLFQAWSNDLFKSVEHKVTANAKVERYSIAYFMCPSYDSMIGSVKEPSHYKKFTFGEYRQQVQEDVRKTGHKAGLTRFLI